MRILFLTQVLPYPLDAGPKVRAYYTLRHLAERHAVTLATFVRPSDPPEAQAHLAQWCERVVALPMPRAGWRDALAFGRSLATGLPFLITRDAVPAMHAALAKLARAGEFDFVHADQLWMAPYALAAKAAAPSDHRPITVLDQHNAVYRIPERMATATRNPLKRRALQREAGLLAKYEAQTCREFDRLVTVTDTDREALLGLYPNRPPVMPAVIPICVAPNGHEPAASGLPAARVLFLGGMHWPPNAEGVRWYAREAWPAIRARLPQAEFWAVGKQPPAELEGDWAASQGMRATGYLPDLADLWRRVSVFVVPLLAGGGMRVKILDAWMRGVPVVSTTVGAEGLQVEDGVNILLADTAQALADATTRVLTEPGLAQRLAEAGQRTVRRYYDWRKVYAAWDAVYAA